MLVLHENALTWECIKLFFLSGPLLGLDLSKNLQECFFLFSVCVEYHHHHTIQQPLNSEPNHTVPGHLDVCKALDTVLNSL